jgi:hypothetical protein
VHGRWTGLDVNATLAPRSRIPRTHQYLGGQFREPGDYVVSHQLRLGGANNARATHDKCSVEPTPLRPPYSEGAGAAGTDGDQPVLVHAPVFVTLPPSGFVMVRFAEWVPWLV